ncbi:alpha/beta hydrolase [Streptomyces sp. NPDC006627]|uniref:alpha/beta hydrolase n=1 Tax=Streptomyces sp. NPDC006627 TaxID=3154679 RepID=UPI0033AAB6D1
MTDLRHSGTRGHVRVSARYAPYVSGTARTDQRTGSTGGRESVGTGRSPARRLTPARRCCPSPRCRPRRGSRGRVAARRGGRGCRTRPARARRPTRRPPFPGARRIPGPRNVLLLQNRRDASTPHRGEKMPPEKFGDRARLVSVDDSRHGVYVLGNNSCALKPPRATSSRARCPRRTRPAARTDRPRTPSTWVARIGQKCVETPHHVDPGRVVEIGNG